AWRRPLRRHARSPRRSTVCLRHRRRARVFRRDQAYEIASGFKLPASTFSLELQRSGVQLKLPADTKLEIRGRVQSVKLEAGSPKPSDHLDRLRPPPPPGPWRLPDRDMMGGRPSLWRGRPPPPMLPER